MYMKQTEVFSFFPAMTVKPVLRDHLWETEKVVF